RRAGTDPPQRYGSQQAIAVDQKPSENVLRAMQKITDNVGTTEALMRGIGAAARAAAHELALARPDAKNRALAEAAKALRRVTAKILEANVRDVEAARAAGRPDAFIDRLTLTEARVAAIAKGLEDIAALADPVGAVLADWTRPNGLRIQRVRVPIGVIGIIYESRPNVTADAGALSLK